MSRLFFNSRDTKTSKKAVQNRYQEEASKNKDTLQDVDHALSQVDTVEVS